MGWLASVKREESREIEKSERGCVVHWMKRDKTGSHERRERGRMRFYYGMKRDKKRAEGAFV
jgi:hypothetical protein